MANKSRLIVSIIIVLLFVPLSATTTINGKKVYTTKSIKSEVPEIDGSLEDPAWREVEWESGFIQRFPDEGKKSSQTTRFKILYDKKHIYIAIHAEDKDPELIVKRMSRRDQLDGDWLRVGIDSYYDLNTAFCFTVNAAGVKGDELITNNGSNSDPNWDPIWYVKTTTNDWGWLAEMKIPLDQLRFAKDKELIWGLQITRKIFRNEETANWQHIPQDAPGLVHLYGELRGIENLKPKIHAGITPYTVGKAERFDPEQGNPFATGELNGATFGLDGKVNLSSDLTLDFTINPDFGQVEADPSEVNLTAFETYFTEKRPFFVEGKNIFNFQIMGGDGSFSSDNLFYSRRIGRRPQFSPDLNDNEYADIPQNTSIIGAFKLTGKTKKGLSIGILDSITSVESAEIAFNENRRSEIVEPFTNYFAMRLQQDFGKGNTRLGAMITSTNRSISNPDLNFLHKSAYSGGIDFSHRWKDRKYALSMNLVFSHVMGDPEAILNTQESSRRYFQRPDADHITLDPNRTSLSGYGGTFTFSKSGNFRYSGGVTFRSPGLELNDVGYLRSADVIMQWVWANYRFSKPFSIFQQLSFNFNQWQGWNFGLDHIFDGGNISFYSLFKNYWGLGSGFNLNGESLSASALRGGPSLRSPGGTSNWINLHSDSRKKIRFNIGGSFYRLNDISATSNSFWAGITYHPSNTLSISAYPNYSARRAMPQYVTTVETNNGDKYIMAEIDQETLGVTLRLNYSITPNLSIQFYGQPFISMGEYYNIKRVIDPRAIDYNDRYHVFDENEISYDSDNAIYEIDENQDGTINYSIDNPDFKFLQFRSNLVLRWEYTPGSTVYLIWSQGKTDYDSIGDFTFSNGISDLFSLPSHNVFLVKFTYRFKI